MVNSKVKGDTTEAKVLEAMISWGYTVSIPFGDNEKYDLIIDVDGMLFRVQCKTAWQTAKGTIRFNTHSQTTMDGDYLESTYHGEIDAFLARYPDTETLFWIPIEEATDQKMELRYSAKIDHPSINWASEYELDPADPDLPGGERT